MTDVDGAQADEEEITLPSSRQLLADPEARQAQVTLALFRLSNSTGCPEGIEQAYSLGYRAGAMAAESAAKEVLEKEQRSHARTAAELERVREWVSGSVCVMSQVEGLGVLAGTDHGIRMSKLLCEGPARELEALLSAIREVSEQDMAFIVRVGAGPVLPVFRAALEWLDAERIARGGSQKEKSDD